MPSQKRIVVCADGTWNDPEGKHPTNVLRMARAIQPIASDGVKQIVFYDWGVGSYYSQLQGGLSGVGLMKNIQDGYRFIVQNHHPDDEIFLFGYSRGAYTVRCLAGMLNKCGILSRGHAAEIPKAFRYYKKRSHRPGSKQAHAWRCDHGLDGARGVVKFIGVWDTVGALGIPTRALAFAEEHDLFFDPELGSNVRVARHAVSLDERRSDFAPTLWSQKEAADIKQVWFAGVHGDIGGGEDPKHGKLLSDVPLAWMAREATEKGLQFEDHLFDPATVDPLARQHDSVKSFWRVLGKTRRTLDADAVVHRSVQTRYEAGRYDSKPLDDWLAANDGYWGDLED